MRPPADEAADLAAARAALVTQLAADGVGNARTREALARVPRHRFVPAALRHAAYDDRALPIGDGQTISQPRIVVAMTSALAPGPDDTVLEIGTGSGYQTAVLAELARVVYTIERREALAAAAAARLAELGYANVRARVGDGRAGWPEAAPFPAIIVTAGSAELPSALWEQLAERGRIVAPIGPGRRLTLLRIEKVTGVRCDTNLGPCAFVPLLPGEVRDDGRRAGTDSGSGGAVADRHLAFDLAGPAGPLEALYQYTEADDREAPAAAVVCHPHPLFGGTMHNKVVYRLARAFRQAGLPVLRFNFRGVGRSAGRYDEARGEVDDARAALDWLAARRPAAALWAAGFSFGARVALAAGATDPRVTRLAVAGLSTRVAGAPLPSSLGGRPLLVVQGERDEHGPPEAVRGALAPYGASARLEVVPGADHFFEGHLDVLEGLVHANAREGLAGAR